MPKKKKKAPKKTKKPKMEAWRVKRLALIKKLVERRKARELARDLLNSLERQKIDD